MENNEKNIANNRSQRGRIELLKLSIIYSHLCTCINWLRPVLYLICQLLF